MNDDSRFDRQHPDVAMQTELWDVLQRYPDVVNERPGYVAALLADYADSIRHEFDLEGEIVELGDGMDQWKVGDENAFLNVPRKGEYADIDEERLNERLEDSE